MILTLNYSKRTMLYAIMMDYCWVLYGIIVRNNMVLICLNGGDCPKTINAPLTNFICFDNYK